MAFPIERFEEVETPFYYYDLRLLRRTLDALTVAADVNPAFRVHYALKANNNPEVLRTIAAYGLGADTVSGGEMLQAINAGIPAEKILFAGVGKTDREIERGLNLGIGCFNVESVEELKVISELAVLNGTVAPVSLRVNPGIDAHTHEYITTGLEENKFGIARPQLDEAAAFAVSLPGVKLLGLHFHIGSQILDLEPYKLLCRKVNELQDYFEMRGIHLERINVGGGLGIDYDDPDGNPIPDFAAYFNLFNKHLKLREGQTLHFELGRAIVAQCGSLVSRVVFVKEGVGKKFAILDAGMTELIRPALYDAHHNVQNISASHRGETVVEKYDVVGPICESSDCFAKDEGMLLTKRGDLVVLRSAGAYGEVMSSRYNARGPVKSLI